MAGCAGRDVLMDTTRRVEVNVTPSYTVHVGAGLLERLGDFVGDRPVALITDRNVDALYGARAKAALATAGAPVTHVVVDPGEGSKSIAAWTDVLRAMAAGGLDRGCRVVALGGGIVGDLAGFAAASHLRGVAWVQAPTSLLAMVDASVGGKTGLNLPEGKNLVGAFWQPLAVVADVATLASLPEREFRQGGVELYKHGMLADPTLLELFGPDFGPSAGVATLIDAVARSVAIKAEVVAQDEHEQGVRAHLNLGHSFGHALEGASDHAVPHGDAVAYGLLFATLLARERGWTDLTPEAMRLLRWLEPVPLPDLGMEALTPFLARDKKNRRGRKRFVLLQALTRPEVVDDVSDQELQLALRALKEATHDLGA